MHVDHGLVDLGQHRPAADEELVAGLARGLLARERERVVDDEQVARPRGPVHRAELGLLLAHVRERFVHLLGGHGLRLVLHTHALVLDERDGRLHLDDRDEGERRALFELDVLEVGLVHRFEPRLGEGPAVDVGDQVLGDLAPHVVGEVHLDERARHVALAEAGQTRLLLHAAVGALPLLPHDLLGRLDRETPLAALDLLDLDLHQRSTVVREGGVEPPKALGPLDPKSSAFASFATLAGIADGSRPQPAAYHRSG